MSQYSLSSSSYLFDRLNDSVQAGLQSQLGKTLLFYLQPETDQDWIKAKHAIRATCYLQFNSLQQLFQRPEFQSIQHKIILIASQKYHDSLLDFLAGVQNRPRLLLLKERPVRFRRTTCSFQINQFNSTKLRVVEACFQRVEQTSSRVQERQVVSKLIQAAEERSASQQGKADKNQNKIIQKINKNKLVLSMDVFSIDIQAATRLPLTHSDQYSIAHIPQHQQHPVEAKAEAQEAMETSQAGQCSQQPVVPENQQNQIIDKDQFEEEVNQQLQPQNQEQIKQPQNQEQIKQPQNQEQIKLPQDQVQLPSPVQAQHYNQQSLSDSRRKFPLIQEEQNSQGEKEEVQKQLEESEAQISAEQRQQSIKLQKQESKESEDYEQVKLVQQKAESIQIKKELVQEQLFCFQSQNCLDSKTLHDEKQPSSSFKFLQRQTPKRYLPLKKMRANFSHTKAQRLTQKQPVSQSREFIKRVIPPLRKLTSKNEKQKDLIKQVPSEKLSCPSIIVLDQDIQVNHPTIEIKRIYSYDTALRVLEPFSLLVFSDESKQKAFQINYLVHRRKPISLCLLSKHLVQEEPRFVLNNNFLFATSDPSRLQSFVDRFTAQPLLEKRTQHTLSLRNILNRRYLSISKRLSVVLE